MAKRDLLARATNDFGSLSTAVRERLFRYFDDPSAENWSSINGIIINAKTGSITGRPPKTVWQAVVAIDPSFKDIGLPQRAGAKTPHEERWRKWPDALLVARAIKSALDQAHAAPPPPRHRR